MKTLFNNDIKKLIALLKDSACSVKLLRATMLREDYAMYEYLVNLEVRIDRMVEKLGGK